MAAAILLSSPVQTFANEISAPGAAQADQGPVKGSVVDENGLPLIGYR